MHEELGKHLLTRANPEKLGVRSQFGPIIRRRCRGGRQLEGCCAERLGQQPECLRIVMFDDARLVQHDAPKRCRIKPMQAFVVGDVDAGPYVCTVAANASADAKRCCFVGGLSRYRQRRQDQYGLRRVLGDSVGPRDLHATFPKPGVSEDRRAATTKRPLGKRQLMREQRRRKRELSLYPGWRSPPELLVYEVTISHAHSIPLSALSPDRLLNL